MKVDIPSDGESLRRRPQCAGRVIPAAIVLLVAFLAGCRSQVPTTEPSDERGNIAPDASGVFHVQPGENIQTVLDAAAKQAPAVVKIHAGTYRPSEFGQALIRFNRQHDGLVLEAEGEVVLTAANPVVANPDAPGFPAVVNHVVFFGDGITGKTVLRGVQITGANGFVATDREVPMIEPDSPLPELEKNLFFYADGGAIKIFGRSYPVIEDVDVVENRTRLCGGGVSVEHRGFSDQPAVFRNCRFLNNRCPGTGSAIDVLGGSAVELENCLFAGNIANTGMEAIALEFGLQYKPEHGCGALTVFPESRAAVQRCTFTANWNGVDDEGYSSYADCVFWHNTATDGSRPGKPYELDIRDASRVRGCMIGGDLPDLQQAVSPEHNDLDPPAPEFDVFFQPSAAGYEGVGYRRPDSKVPPPPVSSSSADQ